MSSSEAEAEMSPQASSLEELIRTHPSFSLFLPFFASPVQSGENQTGSRQRVILINMMAEAMMVIEGSGVLEAMFRDLSSKEGPLPASKASIDTMPVVKVTEEGTECAICLAEYEVGGEAKEMPCKHRYHSDCIIKWLGIHGSCPICRYKMPVEEEERKKTGDSDEEGRGRREGFRVSFYIGGSDRGDSDSGPETPLDRESIDESSTQDMEIDNN